MLRAVGGSAARTRGAWRRTPEAVLERSFHSRLERVQPIKREGFQAP
jgi:hypothetical protein